MLKFIRKNIFIIIIFIITLFLGFLTFLNNIDKSFIDLTDETFPYFLVSNILLLLVFGNYRAFVIQMHSITMGGGGDCIFFLQLIN